jgi:hypothetical protein
MRRVLAISTLGLLLTFGVIGASAETFPPPPDYGHEPNESLEQAWGPLLPGPGYMDDLRIAGDVDYFCLATTRDQDVSVSVVKAKDPWYAEPGACQAVDVELLDEGGMHMGVHRGVIADAPAQLKYHAAGPELLYVRITSSDGCHQNGPAVHSPTYAVEVASNYPLSRTKPEQPGGPDGSARQATNLRLRGEAEGRFLRLTATTAPLASGPVRFRVAVICEGAGFTQIRHAQASLRSGRARYTLKLAGCTSRIKARAHYAGSAERKAATDVLRRSLHPAD